MNSLGVLPALQARPYMLERLVRDHGLQRVQGKYLHLVSKDIASPRCKTPIRHIPKSTPPGNYPTGGDAA